MTSAMEQTSKPAGDTAGAAASDEAIFDRLRHVGSEIEPCGSRVTCSPVPTDTDADYLVVVRPAKLCVSGVVQYLSEHGFKWEGGEHYQIVANSDFMSWRRGQLNLIVTASQEFAKKHRAATSLAKRLNLLDKADRIALFQAVLYGNSTTPSPAKED